MKFRETVTATVDETRILHFNNEPEASASVFSVPNSGSSRGFVTAAFGPYTVFLTFGQATRLLGALERVLAEPVDAPPEAPATFAPATLAPAA